MDKYICIHAHFYQPPRENAWLEVIELQDSAHPFHDWNERISAECYAPNTASRILDNQGVIRKIVNNYARISFNFGPTLLSWMEVYDRETYDAILDADKESMERFSGHGSALAQVYNHIIMPLATRRDKETQVIWGIRDFEFRFGRYPEGMWLAETAVDTETLEVLAEYNIKFTVLAPRQAAAFRKIGENQWHEPGKTGIDTSRPYLVQLPSGKTITLFFYNGQISQAVAFDGLLYDGERFAKALMTSAGSGSEPELIHIATDGETYGHHHKRGDMALAFCLDYIEREEGYLITNYGEYLSKFPPVYEVRIHENSSWSCVHGVERWRNDCGCNSGSNPGWHQKWRRPLREALDWLRAETALLFEREAAKVLRDPWEARNEYIAVILKRSEDNIRKFIKDHTTRGVEANRIFRLMEMERNALLMFTSCGWFFDEISGLETTQILQYACRCIQLATQVSGKDLEEEFINRIKQAPSNLSAFENGAGVYIRNILPARTNLQRVGMHYAVSSIFEEDPDNFPVFNYNTTNEFFVKQEAGEQKLVIGKTRVRSNVTRTEKVFVFAVIYLGKHNIIGNISLDMEDVWFEDMYQQMTNTFNEGRLGEVIGVMQTFFGPEKYTLWHLFKDEKRKVLDMITHQSMMELEESLRRIYNRDYPLVTALVNNDIPIPKAYRTTFEYILNADLLKCFQSHKINVKELARVMNELQRWHLTIQDPGRVSRLAGDSIFKEMRRISAERGNVKRIDRLNKLFPLLNTFNLVPDLYRCQNLYFEISSEIKLAAKNPGWLEQFKVLGSNLGVKVELDA